MSGNTIAVLLVDDSRRWRRTLRAHLAALDVQIIEAASGEAALRLFDEMRPDLVVLDIDMPGLQTS